MVIISGVPIFRIFTVYTVPRFLGELESIKIHNILYACYSTVYVEQGPVVKTNEVS